MTQKYSVLQKVLDEAKAAHDSGTSFLTVFDLDSTLFDLTQRIQKIVDDFHLDEAWRAKYPRECEHLREVRIAPDDWSLKDTLGRHGLLEFVTAEFLDDLQKHWFDGFFSNRFLHEDFPLPGAVDYVRALHQAGSQIIYLTGRAVDRMLEGTVKSLETWNFPLHEPGCELILKPDFKQHDEVFKAEVMKGLAQRYQRVWLFDNEPVNLHLIEKECPDVGIIFLETTHSGEQQPAAHLPRVPHFLLS